MYFRWRPAPRPKGGPHHRIQRNWITLQKLSSCSASSPKRQKTDSSEQQPRLPTLLVPLQSEHDEPYAKQALQYANSGSFAEGLRAGQLLRIRKHASDLDIEDCVLDCDQELLRLASTKAGPAEQQGYKPAGAGA